MRKKISVGFTIALAVLTAVVSCVLTIVVSSQVFNGLMSDIPEKENMYDALAEADAIIREHYAGEIDADALRVGVADGYLASLSFGTNYMMDRERYADYKSTMSGVDPANGKAVASLVSEKYGSVGYIRIAAFLDDTAREFETAAGNLIDQGVEGLVLDLRGVESINIASAAALIDAVVPIATEGTQAIATVQDKAGQTLHTFSSDRSGISVNMAVLVNSETAGAGELVACDLRDFGKAVIVGQKTRGCGTYQEIFELSDGSAMVLTVGTLLPYISDSFDGVGVVPDYKSEGERTENLKDDSQFLQAYAVISLI